MSRILLWSPMTVVFLHSRSSANIINYSVLYLFLFWYIQMYILCMYVQILYRWFRYYIHSYYTVLLTNYCVGPVLVGPVVVLCAMYFDKLMYRGITYLMSVRMRMRRAGTMGVGPCILWICQIIYCYGFCRQFLARLSIYYCVLIDKYRHSILRLSFGPF